MMKKTTKKRPLLGNVLNRMGKNTVENKEPEIPASGFMKERNKRTQGGAESPLSSDLRTVVQREINPGKCRLWEFHNRRYDLLDESRCRDLIEDIRSQGQKIPAIVREVHDGGDALYEVICGARRLWVAKYLNMPLLIEIKNLTDEESFRIADAENR